MTSIWIYVTNLESQLNISLAAHILDAETNILCWSLDTEDKDKVLRVETTVLKEDYIPMLLAKHKMNCFPMPD
ncbi:MAG: hypothetical protein ACPGED_03080 [Flavobacteriales bacterium]